MQIAGVIAEYNPFHCGHAYHLRQTKQAGADAVVAVMSGNFVQRGTPAILSAFSRSKVAAQCGADLVVELPLPWAAGRAQTFAEGAVSVLDLLGCVRTLSFGSECGDVGIMQQTAAALREERTKARTQEILTSGNITFAAARQQAVCALFGETVSAVLRAPNDTLAVEYMLAAERLGASFSYSAVPRIGLHDAENTAGFASASQIRDSLLSGKAMFGCPPEMETEWASQVKKGAAPARMDHLERAILADWRTASPSEIAELPDVSEGLEHRLLDAARQATSLSSFYDLAKTKRYTHARIRRIVLSRLLRIQKEDVLPQVPYVRVLAVGERGTDILRAARLSCAAPLLMRTADRKGLDADGERIFDLQIRADELYALMLPEIKGAGASLRTPMYLHGKQE